MAATEADAGAEPKRWTARAFGLEIDLSFPAPGLPAAVGPATGRPVRADLVSPEEIDADWPAAEARSVLEERFGDGEPERTIDTHPEAGYRLYARGFGLARIAPDGGRIVCSPPDMEPWSWQRFLVGRILPWAAVLRGLEPLHAGAVEIDGRAVAFIGATGAGKTSLTLQLVARGARFVTDDVLTVESRDGVLLSHPGASLAAVRSQEKAAIPAPIWNELGTELGESGKTYLSLPRSDGPLELAAVYFLRLGAGGGIERIDPPDPRQLLASTFVLGVQTPERLLNQLEVCSALARQVPMFWLDIDRDEGSARLAEKADAHARNVAGAA
jgi:hypothetical protein